MVTGRTTRLLLLSLLACETTLAAPNPHWGISWGAKKKAADDDSMTADSALSSNSKLMKSIESNLKAEGLVVSASAAVAAATPAPAVAAAPAVATAATAATALSAAAAVPVVPVVPAAQAALALVPAAVPAAAPAAALTAGTTISTPSTSVLANGAVGKSALDTSLTPPFPATTAAQPVTPALSSNLQFSTSPATLNPVSPSASISSAGTSALTVGGSAIDQQLASMSAQLDAAQRELDQLRKVKEMQRKLDGVKSQIRDLQDGKDDAASFIPGSGAVAPTSSPNSQNINVPTNGLPSPAFKSPSFLSSSNDVEFASTITSTISSTLTSTSSSIGSPTPATGLLQSPKSAGKSSRIVLNSDDLPTSGTESPAVDKSDSGASIPLDKIEKLKVVLVTATFATATESATFSSTDAEATSTVTASERPTSSSSPSSAAITSTSTSTRPSQTTLTQLNLSGLHTLTGSEEGLATSTPIYASASASISASLRTGFGAIAAASALLLL